MRAHKRTSTVDNAALDRQFSVMVKKRDDHRCRFEIWKNGFWVACGSKGSPDNPLDSCHVYPRVHAPAVRYDAANGLTGCRLHHDIFDGRLKVDGVAVRIPPYREVTAWTVVRDGSKVPPPRKIPPAIPEQI